MICLTRDDLQRLGHEEQETLLVDEAGGKDKNLWHMTRLGVPVPEWFVIRASSFKKFVLENGMQAKLSGELTKLLALPMREPGVL